MITKNDKEQPQYDRIVKWKTRWFEVVVTRWFQDGMTPIHDHGSSRGLVFIRQGQVKEDIYSPSVAVQKSQIYSQYSLLQVEEGLIHRMKNISSVEQTITWHVYWPPLEEMDIFKEPSH